MKLNKDTRNLNCPYSKAKLNEEVNLKGCTDSGATVALISDAVLSEKQLKSLRAYNGNVKDANGNLIDILGEINVVCKVKTLLIYEKLLVLKKTSAIAHDLLIGMNILKFSEKALSKELFGSGRSKLRKRLS